MQEKLDDKDQLVVVDSNGNPIIGNSRYNDYADIMKNAIEAYFKDEPDIISQKNLDILLDAVETRYIYDDRHQSNSALGLTVGVDPLYPRDYPIADITPRYRKSFNETMYRTSMQVFETDILIRYEDRWIRYDRKLSRFEAGKDWNNYAAQEQAEFSIYFQYHQTSKKRIHPSS